MTAVASQLDSLAVSKSSRPCEGEREECPPLLHTPWPWSRAAVITRQEWPVKTLLLYPVCAVAQGLFR